ncbi:MAG: hybrid sensor histidine kinase/response regulator [Gammaproteobacteria bacterium]|nr:hybrid sensor histidine kinase/response regulator [Gammaproteobacteria bacterium]
MNNDDGLIERSGNVSSTQRKRVEAELVKLLYQQARTVMLGLMATASVIAIIFYNNIPNIIVISWFTVVFGLTLIRYLSAWQFNARVRSVDETVNWGWRFTFFAFLSGCTWGAAAILFYTPENLQLFFILTLIVIGLTITSMAALSAFIWAYYAYAIPAMLPLVWRYMNMDHQEYYIFGILILILIITLFPFAKVNHKTLRHSVMLRFENIDLVHQLTEQKEKAEQAVKVAEEANITKTRFLAAASHDLRQPLHAMGLFLGALEDRIEKSDQKIIVHKIQKSSHALSELLDSLLDISKLDAGVVRSEPRSFCLQALFDELKYEFEHLAEEKNISLRFKGTKICLHTDYAILVRIVRNLVSNAIRYTKNGGVVIGCRPYKGKMLLAVYDTGIGIHQDEMTNVFKEFQQLHNPERDRSKGLGLGLAIVKRMAHLLEMPLSIRSIPGNGSMFGLVMSVSSWKPERKVSEERKSEIMFFDDKLVLIIDDEMEVRDSLTELLQSWHCEVISASSCKEALSALNNSDLIPDIILADYRLRDNEKGNDVIRKVQATYPAQEIPAIIITGDTAPDRIKEANESGHMILHKPVSPNGLRVILGDVLL